MSDTAWLDRYRTLSSGTLGHLGSDGFLDWGIQPLYRPVRMLGVALTVSCLPTDNAPLADAARAAEPGTVLVVARHGDRRHAAWGGLMSRAASHRGLAGTVLDGAATDWREVTELQYPVFCRNLSALTTRRRELPGTVGEPIVCGGVTVHTGDIVLGDDDGVVALPAEGAREALESALRFERWEHHMRAGLDAGLEPSAAREAAQRAMQQES
jgi:regulator of RNase E activity RraA